MLGLIRLISRKLILVGLSALVLPIYVYAELDLHDIRPSDYDERISKLKWTKLDFDELDKMVVSTKQYKKLLDTHYSVCVKDTNAPNHIVLKWVANTKYFNVEDISIRKVLTDETTKVENCLIEKYGWTREGIVPWWLKMPDLQEQEIEQKDENNRWDYFDEDDY